jgi:hypothetical protein
VQKLWEGRMPSPERPNATRDVGSTHRLCLPETRTASIQDAGGGTRPWRITGKKHGERCFHIVVDLEFPAESS